MDSIFNVGQKVRVIKCFMEARTPCPPIGTLGIVHREIDSGGYIGVSFPLPMLDTEGAIWTSQGQEEDFMRLNFTTDEIEVIQ